MCITTKQSQLEISERRALERYAHKTHCYIKDTVYSIGFQKLQTGKQFRRIQQALHGFCITKNLGFRENDGIHGSEVRLNGNSAINMTET